MSESMSMYDVIREIVNKLEWPHQEQKARMIEAIKKAEESKFFGTEGMMEL